MLTIKSSRNEVLESQKTVSPGGDESGKGSLFLDRPAASSSISFYSNISPDDTGAVSGGHGGDIVSQQTVLSMASIAPGADNADKGSLALDIVSSRTSNISQDDSGEAAVKISNYCIGDAKLQQVNIAMMVEEDLDSMQKVEGIQEIAEALDTDLEKGIPGLEQDLCSQRIANTISPTQAPARNHWQWIVSMLRDRKGDESEKGSVALDNVSPGDTREAAAKISNNCIGDAKLQQANIALMVEEDLDSMQKFGGIQEIAEALDTDLEKGIPGLEQDLCSQSISITLSPTQARARNRWQWIVSMLRDRKGDESEKGSVALDNLSPSDTGEADLEISSASAQVSITVNLDGDNDNCICDVKLQQANIAKMVKEKNFDSIQNFGGIQRIAEALGTDLEKGIPGLKQDPCTQRIDIANSSPSITQAPARGFFKSLLKTCNDWIVFLLFVYAMLLLGFGIVMKSPKDWHKGVITILFIMVLVVIHSLRELWLERSRQMSRRQSTSEMHQVEVEVIRGGSSQKVFISDVLLGDIVCLERGSLVPADGLLVSGEYIKLDDDLDSIINNENPFLFYGPKVIDGKGRMLVTSVGMNTTLGDLLNKVTYGPLNKTPLPVQLDKLNTSIQITGLLLSILNLVVLFFHFMLQKKRFHFNLPDLKGKAVASKGIMDTSKKIFWTPNGKFNTLSTSILTFLFGVTEGIPFVVTLAIGYWNKKMLFGKATIQEPLACLTMNSVTTVCIDKSGWRSLNPVEVDMDSTRGEIEAWINAGVNIILISEDSVSILEDIASEYRLLPNADKLKLEAKEFRNYTNKKRMDEVDKIILMGGLIPSDKLLLVQCLKKKGHTVAMVGVSSNVIPALKEADVRITIQTFSSEMVRESCNLIIMDGNLGVLVSLVRCGRCIYDNICKYMQLELTMNIAGLLITFITTTIFGHSPITTIQLAWANFVVTLLGGLGLLTEPPSKKLMEKPPLRQTEPLINMTMWTNVVIQALYQSGVSVTWQFKGQTMIGINKEVSNTIIFNSFVLCQVCNIINARQVRKMNVVEHFPRNPLFWLAVGVILLLQVAFIEITHILAVLAYASTVLSQEKGRW
uniref:Cation-transporting P-type ATPase C-terminal domain-containing protein n=1 Tax=Quercus lobata TaxID=97700 RepID=A0A7N2LSR9_QUELO